MKYTDVSEVCTVSIIRTIALMMERLHNAVSKNIVIFILAALRT
jgi:hypothetical protein